MKTELFSLKEKYEQYKIDNPKSRIRNAAIDLNVSEMQLLACYIGEHVTRLNTNFKELLKDIHLLGQVMALTRNEYAVHERKGVYDNVSFMKGGHNMGLAVNPDIDLRLFMNEWKYAFAVEMEVRGKTLYGFQFFNAYGEAVHKIYLTPNSVEEVYHKLVKQYTTENQEKGETPSKEPKTIPTYAKDVEIDKAAFEQEWIDMKDTHHFFGMLRKYKLARTQALRLAPEGYAYQVDGEKAIVQLLEKAAEVEVPIMVFVRSAGCIQIHTGEIKKTLTMGTWFNIMDPLFNLHLDLSGVAETWVVNKNTTDGQVTALEVFGKDGQQIVQFFGKRKPGTPELEEWRSLVAALDIFKIN
ncbi:MAG: hemin-degrading factor [Aureispira sp.]|nr:hemin-degrading factor [Aureispira sp.]